MKTPGNNILKRADASISESKDNPFFIVAIGASAGGLEALTTLLKNLPDKTGMAFVYIQHMDPKHESQLVPILGRFTKMPVVEATNGLEVQKNTLYVIPPDKDMKMMRNQLQLMARKPKPALHLPIDQFFISLAEKKGEHSIGIILSGSGHDGLLGMKAIRNAGGITITQDETAKFANMPKASISEGVVDLILSPDKIARELEGISKKGETIKVAIEDLESRISNADPELSSIIRLIHKTTGVDFTHYKPKTIKRRIIRRMILHKQDSLHSYIAFLKEHPSDIQVLYNDLLINVTCFFRDPEAMKYLRKEHLEKVIDSKTPNEAIRIWVPACSSGEEAYSLAIMFAEILEEKLTGTALQIFATDLSEHSIGKARIGMYTPAELQDVDSVRLQKFFDKVDGSYRIKKFIRDICVFAPHNLFRDPPFLRLDLISCCNLMIYLDTSLQKQMLSIFHYALNDEGLLILGKSESIGNSVQLFSQIDKKYKIFSRKKEAGKASFPEINIRTPEEEKLKKLIRTSKISRVSTAPDLEKNLDELLLNKYLPPCVLINKDLEIILSKGPTFRFLELPSGKASLNLLKMAKKGLAFELKSAVHKSAKTMAAIKKTGIEIQDQQGIRLIGFEVSPLFATKEENLFLVVFEDQTAPEYFDSKSPFLKDQVVKKLQAELTALREDMQMVVEQQEASVEELQSANEEIISSNEELQSINEELETSKEEVESTNEELITINTELQIKNEQLIESYDYADAVFGIIREAVLVLDKNLRIKHANNSFYRTFNLTEAETEGRMVFELSGGQWNFPKLRTMLEDVITKNTRISSFEVHHHFEGVGEKVLLLHANRVIQKIHKQELILLAFEDITEHRHAENLTAEREAWFRNMADNVPVLIWVSNSSYHITFVNKTWLDFTGREMKEELGIGWLSDIHPEDRQSFLFEFKTCVELQKPFETEFRLKRADGEFRWMLNIGKPTYSTENLFSGFIGSCTDIHERKMIHEELERRVQKRTKALDDLNKELFRSNDELKQFAYVASHDLQEPLRKIMAYSERLADMKRQLPEEALAYLDKISSSSLRMSNLIDDLLNLSAITQGEKKFVAIDLNELFKKIIQDFEVHIAQQKAIIQVDQLPVIQCLPVQIEQLFNNLVSNGLKFARKNKQPLIQISSKLLPTEEFIRFPELDKNKTYYELVFKDNGIGFDSKFEEQIFVIFHRLNARASYPGTGIGLALCKKIVNNHRGIIYAKSVENEGAEFHVILPTVH